MYGTLHSGRSGNEPDLRKIGLHPDFWYPVAVARALKRRRTLGVSFGGEPIVLVRTDSGKVFALEDRCAHRQMPLRYGIVTGEQLKCCYHAWTYNADGKCAVPYAVKGVALPRGVRAYPCREEYGLIFVFPGDPALADTVAFPDVARFHAPAYKTMLYSRQVACHYSFMYENLMDMNHQFLHRRLLGKVRATLLDTRTERDCMEVDYAFDLVDRKPPLGGRIVLGDGNPGTGMYQVMTVGVRYPYLNLQLRGRERDDVLMDLWVSCIPVDRDQRVNHTFGLMMVRRPKKVPALIHLFWPFVRYFTERIFAEDRFAVELEQRAHDAQGADWNREILPSILDLRKILIDGGVPLETAAAQPRARAGAAGR